LLSSFDNVKECTTPAVKVKDSPGLDDEGKQRFHTIMAKLLYLAKRARPDILTATSFICTRVKQPTKTDQKKMLQIIGYLSATNV
jgi:hypothetical protein